MPAFVYPVLELGKVTRSHPIIRDLPASGPEALWTIAVERGLRGTARARQMHRVGLQFSPSRRAIQALYEVQCAVVGFVPAPFHHRCLRRPITVEPPADGPSSRQ